MSDDLRPFGNPRSEVFRLEAYPFYLRNRTISRYNLAIEEKQQPIVTSAVIHISTMMRVVEMWQGRLDRRSRRHA